MQTLISTISDMNGIKKYISVNSIEDILINLTRIHLEVNGKEFKYDTKNTINSLREAFNSIQYNTETMALINFDYMYLCVKDLKDHMDEYLMVYNELLADEQSKDVFFNLLLFRLTSHGNYISKAYCRNSMEYFDENIFIFGADEIFVDCGACRGDTIAKFILEAPFYKKIYAYEALHEIFEDCKKSVESVNDDGSIVLREAAVAEKRGKLKFTKGPKIGSSKISVQGELVVDGVTLDEDISEAVTFIKMDIEGSEMEALKGAKRHIEKDTPKLAVCVYHKIDDVWRIPLLIHSFNKNYKFILRHYSRFQKSESIIYGVPKINDLNKGEEESKDMNTIVKRMKYAKLFVQKELMEMTEYKNDCLEAKGWFIKQLDNHKAAIDELRAWVSQLEEGKAWLETQMNNYKLALERKKDI